MKNKLTMITGVAAALIGFSASVQAVPVNPPINGAIDFSDDFTANGTFPSSTALTSITDVTVSGTAGSYSVIPNGTAVSFANVTVATPFTFSPSTAFTGFWTIAGGWSFDVTSTTTVLAGATTLILEGTGTAHGPGYCATPGTWNLTLNQNGGLLNFSGGAAVPDGGATVMLLGTALSAIGLLRKKLIA